MPKKTLFKPFAAKYRKKAKAASKTAIINSLLKEYYDTALEEARRQPKHFGEEASLAEEDPKGVANQYTADYRAALLVKDRTALEYLYIHFLEDHDATLETQDTWRFTIF